MSTVLLNLRGVPEDEAQEVRELLNANGIAFYETPPGRWGISMGAIWLKDERQAASAQRLMGRYQRERRRRVRAEHARQRRQGSARTLISTIRSEPLRMLLYVAIVAVILYFSIQPFFALGN